MLDLQSGPLMGPGPHIGHPCLTGTKWTGCENLEEISCCFDSDEPPGGTVSTLCSRYCIYCKYFLSAPAEAEEPWICWLSFSLACVANLQRRFSRNEENLKISAAQKRLFTVNLSQAGFIHLQLQQRFPLQSASPGLNVRSGGHSRPPWSQFGPGCQKYEKQKIDSLLFTKFFH